MIEIVRATADDAERLTEIAYAAKRHWGYAETWIESWRDTLTIKPEFLEANIAFCASESGRIVGFYVLIEASDKLSIEHLWVEPASIRHGIGRALFQHAVEQAQQAGFDSLKIESDPNAEGFYRKMGAVRVGTAIGEVEGERREVPEMEYRGGGGNGGNGGNGVME
ncbi:MAG TPA: GNAT family N-acetyltransferase [Chthoniobacterales bacterium]|jgi:ribosomal protein S18 acetylase RimI-like enzyme|nr:GNAT family N-acetyltransferase [Chthoniobacterales bacterium]